MGDRVRLLALTLPALVACQRTETVTRVVNLHQVPSCMVPSGTSGEYVATGDYDPPVPNHSSILATSVAGQTIDGIPENVASLSFTATPFEGVSLVLAPSGNVDMLLLPTTSACALANNIGSPIAGMTFGAVSAQTLIANGPASKTGSHPAFSIDLTTGGIAQMTFGLKTPRTQAAFAALGDGRAIVSGGLSGSVPQNDAEVFDESTGDFEPQTFLIDQPRALHSAVTLASGAVLLVGGQNSGTVIGNTAIVTFDAKSSLWHTSGSDSPPLNAPRTNAFAFRLADGNVLVGGGFSDAAQQNPVGLVEFFSADASTLVGNMNVTVPVATKSAFVPLEGGGALYVSNATSNNAWFVSESGASMLPFTAPVANDVKLFPHAGGGALLWNGSSWYLFDPWTMTFSTIANAPLAGPAVDSPIATSDPGMRAWVNDDGTVSLWRDSVRNEFASDNTFLTADTLTTFLAPDTIPAPTPDPTLGLSLNSGETVFVSDSRYLDVEVDVSSTGASLPLVVLRAPSGDIVVGGNDCPFLPSATVSAVHVVRLGPLVQFAAGGAIATCATIDPNQRVSIGIRGGGNGSRALDLHVARLAR